MSEEKEPPLTSLELAGFFGFNAMQGMKYALPIVIMLALSANFIERVTLVVFKIGGK